MSSFKVVAPLEKILFNPLPPMSDQERISPYIINTTSSIEVMRVKKNINSGVIS